MEIKLNDVYRFRYNEDWIKKNDPYWCFDGQLIVKQRQNGKLYLEDTYWWGGGESKTFTLEQALEKGTLTFVCNLDDVKEIKEYYTQYYSDDDIFDLSYQHGCYKRFYIKKDAKHSPEKMKTVLEEKIAEEEHKIEWATNSLKRYKEKLQKLENGDLDVWI